GRAGREFCSRFEAGRFCSAGPLEQALAGGKQALRGISRDSPRLGRKDCLRAGSSMVEHCPFKAGVLGSSPSRLTEFRARLSRDSSRCQFESGGTNSSTFASLCLVCTWNNLNSE